MMINHDLHLPFLGREKETRAIADALTQHRLVTIAGIGGMGKTRIALAICDRLSGEFTDGIHWVSLSEGVQGDHLSSLIANIVIPNVQEVGNSVEQLAAALQEKQLLIVLDSYEHLQNAEPDLITLLSACPSMKFLVTSRTVLNTQYGQTYNIAGLPLPPDDASAEQQAKYAAVRLFVSRAAHRDPDFDAAQQGYEHISHICRMVGGMPLAIELAASWVGAISCEDIAAGIETRIDILQANFADFPARHRSMGIVLEQMWARLTPDEQRCMRYLSIFEGAFTTEAATEVLPDGLFFATLKELVNLDLVKLDRDQIGAYVLHDVIRQYAQQLLAENPEERKHVEENYATYYMQLLAAMLPRLDSSDLVKGLHTIQINLRNIRSAWRHAARLGLPPLLHTSSHALIHYYGINRLVKHAITDFGVAIDYLKENESVPETNRTLLLLEAEHNLVVSQLAERGIEEMIEVISGIYQRLLPEPFDWVSGLVLLIRGQLRHHLSQLDAAEDDLRNSFEILQSIEQELYIDDWMALLGLGRVLGEQGKISEAEDTLQKALRICEARGSIYGQQFTNAMLGVVCVSYGQYRAGAHCFQQTLQAYKDTPNAVALAGVMLGISQMFYQVGQQTEAVFLMTVLINSNAGMESVIRRDAKALIEIIRNEIPVDEFQRAVARGHSWIDADQDEFMRFGIRESIIDYLDEVVSEGVASAGDWIPKVEMPGRIFGRAVEIDEILQALGESRVVTLVGMGGSGKTHLAQVIAERARGSFQDGVRFVYLTDADEHLVAAISSAIFPLADSAGHSIEKLAQSIGHKSQLLIIDALECASDEVGQLDLILGLCPNIKLLITSRLAHNLNAKHQRHISVGPLVPGPNALVDDAAHSPAVEMFIDRAIHADSHFNAEAQGYEHIKRICELVDAMPLAIELAACWVSSVSCEVIASQLEANKSSILTRNEPGWPVRHQSVDSLLNEMWNQLPVADHLFLKGASFFTGPFTFKHVASVFGSRMSLFSFRNLIMTGALIRLRDGRFRLHRLIRHIVNEKLASDLVEKALLEATYIRYYLGRFIETCVDLDGDDLSSVLVGAGDVFDEIRNAWFCAARTQSFSLLYESSCGITHFYTIRGIIFPALHDFETIVQQMSAHDACPERDTALALIEVLRCSLLSYTDPEAALDELEALPHRYPIATRVRWTRALHLMAHGRGMLWNQQFAGAIALLQQSLAVFENDREPFVWMALSYLGYAYAMNGQFALGYQMLQEALEICQQRRSTYGIAVASSLLSLTLIKDEQYLSAAKYARTALETCQDYIVSVPLGVTVICTAELLLKMRHRTEAALLAVILENTVIGPEPVMRMGGESLLRRVKRHLTDSQRDAVERKARTWYEPATASEQPLGLTPGFIELLTQHIDGFIQNGSVTTRLTNRECDVLKLVAVGMTDKAIAEVLVISSSTVSKHLQNINQKLDVHNRLEAVNVARDLGYIE